MTGDGVSDTQALKRTDIGVVMGRNNRPLLATMIGSVVMQLAVIYLEPLQRLFHTAPLTSGESAICLLLPLVVLAATEADKWRCRRKRRP